MLSVFTDAHKGWSCAYAFISNIKDNLKCQFDSQPFYFQSTFLLMHLDNDSNACIPATHVENTDKILYSLLWPDSTLGLVNT